MLPWVLVLVVQLVFAAPSSVGDAQLVEALVSHYEHYHAALLQFPYATAAVLG